MKFNKSILIDILDITKEEIRLRVRTLDGIHKNPYHAHYLSFKCHYKYISFMLRQYIDRPQRRVYVRDILTWDTWLYFDGSKKFPQKIHNPMTLINEPKEPMFKHEYK